MTLRFHGHLPCDEASTQAHDAEALKKGSFLPGFVEEILRLLTHRLNFPSPVIGCLASRLCRPIFRGNSKYFGGDDCTDRQSATYVAARTPLQRFLGSHPTDTAPAQTTLVPFLVGSIVRPRKDKTILPSPASIELARHAQVFIDFLATCFFVLIRPWPLV